MELSVQVAAPDGRAQTETREVWGAEICPACFTIRGALTVRRPDATEETYEQRCSCHWPLKPQDRWPGSDFSTYLELCHSCGIEPIKSGSRWSLFFCRECADRVTGFNRQYGEWVIPIGRHSIMHSVALGEGDDALPFTHEVRGLFDAIDHLGAWARRVVRQNALSLSVALLLDFDPSDLASGIDLASYINALRGTRLTKEDAFRGLQSHFVGST